MKQRNIRMIETNGIRLKVIVEGSGPLVLLLHGFPQCAYLWRNQIDDLVAAGYQVAVPDQRGYGGSDKPADPQAYDTVTLSADAVGIADALGHETFTLVTHDWGAIVGWYMASLYPQTGQGGVRAERAANYWHARRRPDAPREFRRQLRLHRLLSAARCRRGRTGR